MKRSRPDAEGGNTVLTVQRGLEVLRAFRAESKPRSNAELVKLTGLSKATVSRLTSTLLELGYLRRAPCGRLFELSSGALRFGHAFIATDPVQARAHTYMQELADRLNVSVALARGNGLDVLYVAYCVSHSIATLRLGVGSVLPMATTMIVRTYLWGLPVPQRTAQVRRLREAWAAQGATDAQLEEWDRGLADAFQELETRGICHTRGGPGLQRNAFGVGAPLRVAKQRIPMALGLGSVESASREDAKRRQIEPALLRALADLEALLSDVDLDQ